MKTIAPWLGIALAAGAAGTSAEERGRPRPIARVAAPAALQGAAAPLSARAVLPGDEALGPAGEATPDRFDAQARSLRDSIARLRALPDPVPAASARSLARQLMGMGGDVPAAAEGEALRAALRAKAAGLETRLAGARIGLARADEQEALSPSALTRAQVAMMRRSVSVVELGLADARADLPLAGTAPGPAAMRAMIARKVALLEANVALTDAQKAFLALRDAPGRGGR